MKKLFLVALIITTCIAFAGCGAEEQAEPTEPTELMEATVSQDGTYEIRITGDEDNEAAAQLLDLMNQYRSEQGLDALEWNDAPAEMLRVRAAELAINFSETRLDGTQGEEMLRGCLDSVDEGTGELLEDEEFVALLKDPEKTSFCAGAFQSYSGPIYVAAGIYSKPGTKEVPSKATKERTFTLLTKDDALNCRGQLMDQEMEPEDPKELYAGEGYYYCIINENKNVTAEDIGDNEEELVGMYAWSSDPDVIAIDAHGDVTAKRAGTATLTVRPAKESGIEFVQEVEVR